MHVFYRKFTLDCKFWWIWYHLSWTLKNSRNRKNSRSNSNKCLNVFWDLFLFANDGKMITDKKTNFFNRQSVLVFKTWTWALSSNYCKCFLHRSTNANSFWCDIRHALSRFNYWITVQNKIQNLGYSINLLFNHSLRI